MLDLGSGPQALIDDDAVASATARIRAGSAVVLNRRTRVFTDAWLVGSASQASSVATLSEHGVGPLVLIRPVQHWKGSPPALSLHLESLGFEPYGVEPPAAKEVWAAISALRATNGSRSVPNWLRVMAPHPGGVLAHRTPIETGFALVAEANPGDNALLRRLNPNALGEFCQLELFTVCKWFEARAQPRLIEAPTDVRLPTPHGTFTMRLFEDPWTRAQHVAMIYGELDGPIVPLVRLHSECLTGDIMGSLRCDCGSQLDTALSRIASRRCGILLYMRQEGRGIGLFHKLRAYEAQDMGLDTVDANESLGFPPDLRNYSQAAQILQMLGVERIHLLTNNPAKISALSSLGIEVLCREQLVVGFNRENQNYLETKRERMGHLLRARSLVEAPDPPS